MSDVKKGDKYILEVDTVFMFEHDEKSKIYAKMKGFNVLFFDDEGLAKLKKLDETAISEDAYVDGFKAGMQEGWRFAQRVAGASSTDLAAMQVWKSTDFDDKSEYGASCDIIMSNDVYRVAREFERIDKKKAHNDAHRLNDILDYIEDDIQAIDAPAGSREYDRALALLIMKADKALSRK